MQATAVKPLSGLRILITRPKDQAQTLAEKLRILGATTVELPVIEIMPTEDIGPLDNAIRELNRYDWVIFTSVQGVRHFINRMLELKIPLETLRASKVAAIGPATAAALTQAGKEPDYVPQEFLSERIVDGLGLLRGKRILLARADIASKKLPMILRERGAEVNDIVAYRTVLPRDLTREHLQSVLEQVELVTFTSPSTVQNLAQVLGDEGLRDSMRSLKVACIGPVTVKAVKELGLNVDVVARTHTVDGLVEAIVNEIRSL